MKRFLFSRSLLLVLCLLINCALVWGQSRDNTAPLTNAAVVKLVKAGFKDKSIITIIGSRPASFDISTERLIDLKRTGVSERVILAMIARQEGTVFSDEAWSDDDPFFNSPNNPSSNNASKDPGKPGNANDGNSRITEQSFEAGVTLGALMAGQKKDLVVSSRLEALLGDA